MIVHSCYNISENRNEVILQTLNALNKRIKGFIKGLKAAV